MIDLNLHLLLFIAAGAGLVLAPLLLGKFVRPTISTEEKDAIYECGEPTIGSSYVQFDIRFYVVALLFIIFDVEVAFFFPWATVFGKATHLMDPNLPKVTADGGQLSEPAAALFQELGVAHPVVPTLPEALVEGAAGLSPQARGDLAVETLAQTLAQLSIVDIAVFFAVLLVGFAYVWKRGDLDWVRALSKERAMQQERPSRLPEDEPVLVP